MAELIIFTMFLVMMIAAVGIVEVLAATGIIKCIQDPEEWEEGDGD